MTVRERDRVEWFPSSPDEQRSVEDTLERILMSAPFQGSRRYPSMLRYVVEKTLQGEQDSLKERTIGIEVFGRSPTYDTSADPVVRFSAGEIRRRIAQFYQNSPTEPSIVIELPSGTYVPRFIRSQTALPATAAEADRPKNPLETGLHGRDTVRAEKALMPFRKGMAVGSAVLLLLLALWAYVQHRRQADPVTDVWSPMLSSQYPVLISAGQPVTENLPPVPPDISIEARILRPEFRVSVATLTAIANLVGYLKTNNKPFNIRGANQTELEDLHHRPVVLVAGNNNKWTVLLLSALRFHVTHRGALALIEDANDPQSVAWSVDFQQPFKRQVADYAVVARFQSQTTGGPIVVAAGLGSNGTEAAGEFIVSPQALEQLRQLAPHHDLTRNFEAVLKVQVLDGNTGGATIQAADFW